MRPRFPFPFAALLIVVLAIGQASTAHAVLVQGFEVTALGSADVSAVVTASSPPRRLINSLIGSSGQDGANFPLYRSSGIQLTFEEPTSPGGTIERRNLTLYTNGPAPGEQIPIIKGSALGSGGSSQRKVSCPYVFTVTVQVWSGSTLMLSKDLPISTVVEVSGGSDVTPPGGTVTCYTHHKGGGASTGSPKRLSMSEQWPTPRDVTVDGETVSGDELVFEMVSDELPASFDGAELKCATNVAALINGNVVIGNLSLIKDTPVISPRMMHAPVSIELGDDMHHVEDLEDGSISYSLDAGGPGGGGGGQMSLRPPIGHDPLTRPAYSHSWRLASLPVGSALTVEMDVECDDGSGSPPQKFTITGAIPTPQTYIAFASMVPGDDVTVQAISEGRPVGQPMAAGLGSHVQFSAEPTGFTVSGTSSSSSMEIEFPAGTTFEMGGQLFTGNMLHMHSISTHSRRISDVRIVHPPGSPPGTWRLADLGCSSSPPAGETGGRDLAARGPRQSVSLDGSFAGKDKRVIVSDVPDGGIEMVLNGAPSVAFEFKPDPGDPVPSSLSLELRDCAIGTCEPSRSLEITRTGGTFQVLAIFTDGSTPQYVEADRKMIPITVTEAQGGQSLLLSAASPIEPRVILKSYRWLSPYSECFTIEFSEPVQFSSALGTHVARKITFWTNPTSSPREPPPSRQSLPFPSISCHPVPRGLRGGSHHRRSTPRVAKPCAMRFRSRAGASRWSAPGGRRTAACS